MTENASALATNEILYRIYKALNLTLDEMVEAYTLESYIIKKDQVSAYLVKRQDKDFKVCSYEELGIFLDGLVLLKRGPASQKVVKDDVVLSNNLILKKLRIALELKESETEIIFGLGDIKLSKQQLSSLFRKENHKNFKVCSDALLLSFLEGLEDFYYVGETES